MNCIVYASSSVHPPVTIGLVFKRLGIVSCKLVVFVYCNFSNGNQFLENENDKKFDNREINNHLTSLMKTNSNLQKYRRHVVLND